MRRIAQICLPSLFELLFAFSNPAGAKAPDPITLGWAVQEALSQNPQTAAARARWEAAAEETPQARALDAPSFYTMFWAVPGHTPNPFSAREIWYGIKQRFPFPGKLSLKGQVTTMTADMAEQRYMSVQEKVVHQVKAAYYDLFLIHKEIEITRRHLDLAREFSRIAEIRYTTGVAAQGDVLKALVEVSDLSNRVLVLIQRRRVAEAKLNVLLDRDPEASLGRSADFPIRPVVYSLKELQQMALDNRPELKAIQFAIERSEAARALARRDYYPDLMADFSYWDVRNNPNRWMLMVEAKVPIAFWSKGKHDARVRQAEAEKRAWESTYGELKNQILYQVEEAFVAIRVAEDNVDLYGRVIIPQARQAVEAVKVGYQTDRATFLNLVDSERGLLRFELDYYTAVVNFEKGIAGLERAVGTNLRTTLSYGGK